MAMAIALPVGIGIAVWLSEYGRPSALARVAESTVEMLAGAPSIVLALFGTMIFDGPGARFPEPDHARRRARTLVLRRRRRCCRWSRCRSWWPRSARGSRRFPSHVREASYAVGKTKIATTRRVLLPAARPSVITGAMLGVGRVIGDTAIIVVLLGSTLDLQGRRIGSPARPAARDRAAR